MNTPETTAGASVQRNILNAAHAAEDEIKHLVLTHLGESRLDIIQAISDALLLLRNETARLNWLLSGENGATRNGKFSTIDEAFDEQAFVRTREDIDNHILSEKFSLSKE